MNKKLSVLIFWCLALYTFYAGFNWFSPGGNTIPIDVLQSTVIDIDSRKDSNYEIIDNANISTSLLEKYEFHIAIDLSKSVNQGMTQENKDKILIDLISNIQSEFINNKLNANTYFFGTELLKIRPEDVANFSKDKLKEYKSSSSTINGITKQLEDYTDIAQALQKIASYVEQDEEKETFLIFITDDIFSTYNNIGNNAKNIENISFQLDQLRNTSLILYKYPGSGRIEKNKKFLERNFGKYFDKKETQLKNIAKELVANLKLSMYAHELRTLTGTNPNEDLQCIDKSLFKKDNSTIFNTRFRAEFKGNSESKESKKINLNPYEDLVYLNFNFVNDFNYFPIKISLNDISFCLDSTTSIQLKNDVVINSKALELTQFFLEPSEEKLWSVPVVIRYENSFSKSLRRTKEHLKYLKLEYDIEFLGEDEQLYTKIYNTLRQDPSNIYSFVNNRLTVASSQVSQLQSTLANGKREYLLSKTYPPTFTVVLLFLIITFLYVSFVLYNKKPSLDNWTIIKNGNKAKVKSKRILRIGGGNGDPKGDVVIKPYKYKLSLNPFKKQPKDSLIIHFKFPSDKIVNGEINGIYKDIVILNSGNHIHAQLFHEIDLKIY